MKTNQNNWMQKIKDRFKKDRSLYSNELNIKTPPGYIVSYEIDDKDVVTKITIEKDNQPNSNFVAALKVIGILKNGANNEMNGLHLAKDCEMIAAVGSTVNFYKKGEGNEISLIEILPDTWTRTARMDSYTLHR